ncbi:MAG: AAA family ATPase [Candidatus Ranarchaeia archaeon]
MVNGVIAVAKPEKRPNPSTKHVLGVVGMPGAGKTTVIDMITKFGASCVCMGDVIRDEATARGWDHNRKNLSKLMFELREKEGPMVVAKRCVPKIQNATTSLVIIDGLRGLEEVEFFKEQFPQFQVILVHAKSMVRYNRLLNRNRSDDPKDWETFHQRDLNELSIGIGKVIALSDHVLLNNSSLEDLQHQISEHIEPLLELK